MAPMSFVFGVEADTKISKLRRAACRRQPRAKNHPESSSGLAVLAPKMLGKAPKARERKDG